MHKQTKILIRDAFLLALLIAIILYGAKKHRMAQENSYKQRVASQPFTAHEIDEKFVEKINHTMQQVQNTLAQTASLQLDRETIDQLQIIEKKLTNIQEKYTHTSHAMALLGPIGTAAIVLKEADLEKQLLQLRDELTRIIENLSHSSKKIEPARI